MKAEDQTILTFHERVVASSGRFSVSHENYRTWYLHIRDVEETDKGCYMCQVNTLEMQKQIGCLDVLGECEPYNNNYNIIIRPQTRTNSIPEIV